MVPFSAGCFTFIVFLFHVCGLCVLTSVGRFVKLLFVLWFKRVRQTTAGIHKVIFTLLLGSSARNYYVTPRHSK